MSIGRRIRKALGPLERPASELYRRAFIDLDACVDEIEAPRGVARILEIGCGDGVMTERLVRRHPRAEIAAIDISAQPGRQFRGDRARVEFAQQPVAEFVAARDARYDLVLLCDVLHHVPPEERADIVRCAKRALAPGGTFVLKEWITTGSPMDHVAYRFEVHLSGAFTKYEPASYWRGMIADVFGETPSVDERHIPPWRNNLLFRVSDP